MKKFLSLLLALTMLLTLCGAASAEAGVFTGVGDSEIGGKGAIEVAVTVDENGAVTAIEVTKNGDIFFKFRYPDGVLVHFAKLAVDLVI